MSALPKTSHRMLSSPRSSNGRNRASRTTRAPGSWPPPGIVLSITSAEARGSSAAAYPLSAGPLDDVFANLIREEDGRANFFVEGGLVEGGRERITVSYGPKYTVAVVYAPGDREFICFEPMAAITNAFNLAHAGLYQELQSVPAGGSWKESLWLSAA
jgi:hypothetical protein